MWNFDTFEEVLETALENNYKSVWILYRCKEIGINISIKNLYTIAHAYGHKSAWVMYKAKEFNIGNKAEQNESKAEQPKKEKERSKHPFSYFEGIKNKTDLKKTYRKWSKKLHPDIIGGNDTEFIKMKKEYEYKKRYCF